MRKMFSENQIKKIAEEAGGGVKPQDVIDIVNDAIEDGDIDVLTLPESAPAAQQLVGINTSGEQNALGIGDGLVVENSNLKANVLEIDWQNSSTTYIEISQEVYNNITNGVYNEIIIKNERYQNTNLGTVHYIRRNKARNEYSSIGDISSTAINGAGTGNIKFTYFYLSTGESAVLAPNTGYYLSLNQSEDSITIFSVYTWSVGSGTWSYGNAKKGFTSQDIVYVKANSSSTRQARVVWDTIDLTNLFMIGHADEYDSTGTLVAKYRVVVNMVSTGFNNTYTVTDITNA